MSLSTRINEAQQAADLEMTAFLAQMSDSERGAYAGENVGKALDRIRSIKQDRFNYLSEDMRGADNNVTSTAYYISRTGDLMNLTGDIDSVAVKQLTTSDINSDLIARQNEINEWSNENKLDTLFFLQILFLCLTFIASMVYLQSRGLISSYLLNLFIVLAAVFAVFVLVNRARFTAVRRDSRYWHKLRFNSAEAPNIKDDKCGPAVVVPTKKAKKKKSACPSDIASLLGDDVAELPVGWGGSS
uniref:Uncharacterized protein n=1 Tax=viral metagenome TaxID=1070528 RepID=A0A6C0K219_9ZZZZ